MGHARALLGLTNKRKQAEVGALVAKKGLSVRDTEALVRRMQQPDGAQTRRRAATPPATRTCSAWSRSWPRSSARRC